MRIHKISSFFLFAAFFALTLFSGTSTHAAPPAQRGVPIVSADAPPQFNENVPDKSAGQTAAVKKETAKNEPMQKGIDLTHHILLQQYSILWTTMRMKSQLSSAVEESVDNRTKDLMWGTQGIRLMFNQGGIMEKIQEDITYKFNPAYEEMLKKLQVNFSREFNKNLVTFFKQETVAALSLNDDPMARTYIQQSSSEMLRNNGESLLKKVHADLSVSHPVFYGATGLMMGITMMLTKYLAKKFSAKLGGVVLQKLASGAVGAAIPIVGWVITVASVWDLGSTFLNASEDIKESLKTNYSAYFEQQMPSDIWESMEPMVNSAFDDVHANLQLVQEEAHAISQESRILKLTSKLSTADKLAFARKLASIARLMNLSSTDPAFLDEFGEIIRDTSTENFPALCSILNGNQSRARQWFKLLGMSDYYDLYHDLPTRVWEIYPPNNDSAKILKWMAMALPSYARDTAVKLSIPEVVWIMNEFPSRYLPDLFDAKKHDVAEIPNEIAQLEKIDSKESRRPWMSPLEIFYIQHTFTIWLFGFLTCGFITWLLALKFLRGRGTRTVTMVNINVPQPIAGNRHALPQADTDCSKDEDLKVSQKETQIIDLVSDEAEPDDTSVGGDSGSTGPEPAPAMNLKKKDVSPSTQPASTTKQQEETRKKGKAAEEDVW